jgi:hypothetical protein
MEASRHNRTFVFVAGLHRCGTTLLANLIAGHPDVSGFKATGEKMDEGQYLQTVYPKGRERGAGSVGRMGFDRAAYMTETSPLASPANADRLFADWARYWDVSKPVLVEKSPPNVIRMRYLAACFPESHFILIARHPIAASIASKKWCGRNPVAGIIANWAVCYDRALKDGARLKSFSIVRYEDLVADPAAALRPLTERIGLAPLAVAPPGVREALNAKYFEQWRALLKDPKERAMAAMVRPFAEPVAKKFRYRFRDAD